MYEFDKSGGYIKTVYKMNILFTTYRSLGYGGAEISILQYTGELEKRGYNIIIAASQKFEGRNTFIFKDVGKWPYFLRDFYLKRFFIKLIKENNIDLITPQNNITTRAALLAAKKCSIPSLVHIRDLWFACPKSSCLKSDYSECNMCSWKNLLTCSKWYRYPIDLYKWINIKKTWKLIQEAEGKVCVSSTVKKKLAECEITNNVNVNPGARYLEEFENIKEVKEFKKEYNLRKIVVTFMGSFFYTKGIMQVFKFMPDILKENKNVSLLLVGDGPLYSKVKEIARKEEIEEQVVLAGRLPFKKIPVCYATSDILLAPHLWQEPLGATIIEASAAGKPSIISDRGGTIDFKKKFDNIIDPENTKLWKKKTLELIKNSSKRKALGKKARKNVEIMSYKNYIDRMEEIYKNTINFYKKKG